MQNFKSQKGLTIIETLVAIFVIVIGLLAGLSLAVYSTSMATQAKEKVTAYYLAQEGLELIRNYRDSLWLAETAFSLPCDPCYVDYKHDPDFGGTDSALYLDDDSFYVHTPTANPTQYSRVIRTNGDSIISEVTGGTENSVKLEMQLHDWREF